VETRFRLSARDRRHEVARCGLGVRPERNAHSGHGARSDRCTLALLLASLPLMLLSSGCSALLLLGGAGTSAIAFATGELRATEEVPLADLDPACGIALETLGYSEIEFDRSADRARWQAKTAGGDPVDIRLRAKGPNRTEIRIRVGVFGDETRSRLVLEQIHQSL
jgi:hypothetical protein